MNGIEQQRVLPILVGRRVATFPFPMSEGDFQLLIATLELWKGKLTANSGAPPASCPSTNAQ